LADSNFERLIIERTGLCKHCVALFGVAGPMCGLLRNGLGRAPGCPPIYRWF